MRREKSRPLKEDVELLVFLLTPTGSSRWFCQSIASDLLFFSGGGGLFFFVCLRLQGGHAYGGIKVGGGLIRRQKSWLSIDSDLSFLMGLDGTRTE